MSTLIERFGSYVGKKTETDPKAARRLILAAYRGFGWYQKHKPDPRRPYSRQILANASMKFMVDGFSHPQKAALVSIFTPCEILQAFGIHPMCAEMFSTYLNGAGAEAPFVAASEAAGISSTFCSYHKVLMGAAETGVLPKTAFIVNTSLACDANNLTFRAISEQMGIEQMYIDVPYAKNDASVDYVADQLRQLPAFIEKQTGLKMNEVLFREAIERSHETIRLLKATIPYRKTKWLSGDLTSELYEALMVHTALGSREALAYARALLEDFKNAPEDHGHRLLWMHTNPFWQKPVMEMLNYREDFHVAATELSYDAWIDYEEKDPYRFMASRIVYDTYNGPARDRIALAKQMADEVGADGIVVFCHWGCKETCGMSALAKKELEAAGYPTLILNGDGVDRKNTSDGQVSTRLGAFLEMLEDGR